MSESQSVPERRSFGCQLCESLSKNWPVRQSAEETNPVTQLLDEAYDEASDEVRAMLLRQGRLNHLRLGVAIAEMEEFLGDIIWPHAYNRDDETHDSDMRWVSQQYGELFLGHGEELCYDVIAWIKQVQRMPLVLGGGHSACEGLYFNLGTHSGKPRYENKEGAVIHFDRDRHEWVLRSPNQDVCFSSQQHPEETGPPKNGPPSLGWRHSHSTANPPVDTPQIFYDYVHFSPAELIIAKRQREMKQRDHRKKGTSTPILMGGSGVGPATHFLSHVQAERFRKTRQAMHLVSKSEFPLAIVCLAIVGALMFIFCLIVQFEMDFWDSDSYDYYLVTLFMVGFFVLTPVAIVQVHIWNTGETDKHRIWSDVMCLRQCQKDFDLGRVEETIKAIGNTTMFLDPLPGSTSPALMSRIFCIFEIFSTIRDNKTLKAVVSPGGYFSTLPRDIERVSIDYAESRNQHEKDAIMDMIGIWEWKNQTESFGNRADVDEEARIVDEPEVGRARSSMRHQGVASVNKMLSCHLQDAFVDAESRIIGYNVGVLFFIKTLVFILTLYFELREEGFSGVHHLPHLTPRPLCVAVLEHDVESYHEFFWTKFKQVQGPLLTDTAACIFCAGLVHGLLEMKTPRHRVAFAASRVFWDMWRRSIKGIFASGFFMVFMLFHEASVCTLYLCMGKKHCIKFRPIVFACHLLAFLFPHCCTYRGIRTLMELLVPSILPPKTSVLHIGRLIVRKRDVLVALLANVVLGFFFYTFGADIHEGTEVFLFVLLGCCFFAIEPTYIRSPPKPPVEHGHLNFGHLPEKHTSYGSFDH